MSYYNPDFFKPTRPSERLLQHAGEILDDLDPKLKQDLYNEFGASQSAQSSLLNNFSLGE